MRQIFAERRATRWVGLGAAGMIGLALVALDQRRTDATENRDDPPGAAEATALVERLEARLREAESDLKDARRLLALIEGKQDAAPAPEAGAQAFDRTLEGVWRIVSINGNFGREFRDPPYDEYKIMSAGHYFWLSFDRETGAVIRSGGGEYTLDGETYTARVLFSNAGDLGAIVGQEYTGTTRLEGNRCYHYGRMPNGAVYDELWERVH